MAFRGDLANINLASVLQNLLHNEQTGTLRLFDEEREAFIYFAGGHLSMYSSGPEGRTPLSEYLSRSGDATPKQLATARKRLRGRRNLSTVLGRMGVDQEKIRAAIRRFIEEEVCDLFTWESGRFEFTEGAAAAGIFDSDMAAAKLQIDPNGIILEAARRADTWDQINRQIRSDGEVFVLRKEFVEKLESSFEPGVVEVAGYLDGRRNVTAVAEESGLGRFPVLSALSQMLARGAIRPVSLTEVIRLAESALARRDFEEAIRFYRRALDIERNNLDCRRGLIEALDGSGDSVEASAERKLLAVTLADMGRREEAVEELRKAIEVTPTDITAREKYIGLLREMGSESQAEIATLELGKAYLALGIAEKARKTFAEVLEGRPEDPSRVGLMLADACVKAGDVPAAVEAYRKVVSRYLAAGKYDAAAGACEEILEIQPDNAEAKKRLDEINSGKLLRRKRRWRLVRYLLLVSLVVGLGVAWLVYDWLARDYLDGACIEAVARLERAELGSAMECYEDAYRTYPFTRAARSARKMRAALAERLAVRLIGEGKRLEREGLVAEALDCYRRAEEARPSERTLRHARAARASLEKSPADFPGGTAPESPPGAPE